MPLPHHGFQIVLAALALQLTTSAASAQETFTETFDGGSNVGGWSWGTGGQTIVPVNGNPGAHLSDLTLVTAVPVLSTAPGSSSPFTGDLRAKRVTSFGVDIVTKNKGFPVEGNRWLTLALFDDNGTPFDPNDDRGAYFVGDTLVPDAGVPLDARTPPGWASFDFAIDAQADAPPTGWQPLTFGGPLLTWPELMSSVDSVEFWYGEPGTIFLFDSWDVGADNLRVTTETCQVDLGLGGPGAALLSACGDALASGGVSLLALSGAPASSTAFLVIGAAAAPTSFKGGTLVPLPILLVAGLPTDPDGAFELPVPGGGGPGSLFVQVAVPDAAQTFGYALSNALQLDFLP